MALHRRRSSCCQMKRTFAIPFVSAVLGGGVVVAVIAAFGGLGTTQKTVTTIQAAPLAPSNASQQTQRADPARHLCARRAGRRVRHLDRRAESGIAVQPVRRWRNPAPGPGDWLGNRDRRQRHDPHQLARGRERGEGDRELRKRQERSKPRWSARIHPTISPCCACPPTD